MKLYFTLLLIFTICVLEVEARMVIIEQKKMVLTGKVVESSFALNKDQKIKVMFWVSQFPSKINIAPTQVFTLETSYSQTFKFEFPVTTDRFYVTIGYRAGDVFSNSGSTYIMEKEDEISCNLSNQNFEFFGKGSAKMNCQSKIASYKYIVTETEDIHFIVTREFEKLFAYRAAKQDSLLKLRLAAIKKFSPFLSKEMRNIMIANSFGMAYYNDFLDERNSKSNFKRANAFLNSPEYNVNLDLMRNFDPEVIVKSPNFTDLLFEKEIFRSMKFKNGNYDSTVNRMDLVFNNIENGYSGIIREKMLMLFFFNYQWKGNALKYVDRALTLIENESYRDTLNKIKYTYGKDLPFFPFELECDNGKMVKLADFKDKIVVMDFWFTGCVNCSILSERMRPLIQRYKNDPKIIFVSINVDSKKESWLKSVSTGEYTHPESVNLFAPPAGKLESSETYHPLIKAYNITGYPTMFILKNGKMFDFHPPRNAEAISALIEQALVE